MNKTLRITWLKWCEFSCWGIDDIAVLPLVADARFKDSIMTVLIVLVGIVFYPLTYDFVRHNPVYHVLLILWFLVALIYHILAIRFNRNRASGGNMPYEQVRNYFSAAVLGSVLLSSLVTLVAINTLINDGDGFNDPAVIGAVIYFIGLSMMIFVSSASVLLNILLMPIPLAVCFLFFVPRPQYVIAGFLGLLSLTIWSFSKTLRFAFIHQVQQQSRLKELTDALAREKQNAEEANLAKSQFFTSASHDARQPLQAISLLSESLIRSEDLSSKDRILVDKISANLHAIRTMFNRVLDISRIEAGSIEPKMQAVDLASIFKQLEAQFSEIAQHNRLWLRFTSTQAVIWHDPEILNRILSNLIHNALKFTPSGGVWVGYRTQRSCIEVRDSGVGIDVAYQSKIFEDFYQLNNHARTRSATSGVGLGLSIVSRMAQITDTRISVRSKLHHGTTFTVSCNPFKRDNTEIANAKPQDELAALTDSAHNAELKQSLTGLHIVYVEDDEELRELFVQALASYGIVVWAFGAYHELEQGLTEQKSHRIDMVLSDYRLTDMRTGFDVMDSVGLYVGREIPAIILTGDTQIHHDAHALNNGNVMVLQKPVHVLELLQTIQSMRPTTQNKPLQSS